MVSVVILFHSDICMSGPQCIVSNSRSLTYGESDASKLFSYSTCLTLILLLISCTSFFTIFWILYGTRLFYISRLMVRRFVTLAVSDSRSSISSDWILFSQ